MKYKIGYMVRRNFLGIIFPFVNRYITVETDLDSLELKLIIQKSIDELIYAKEPKTEVEE